MGDIQVGDTVRTQGVVESISANGQYVTVKLADGTSKVADIAKVEFVSRPKPPEPTEEGTYAVTGSRTYVLDSPGHPRVPWREIGGTKGRFSWGYIAASNVKILTEAEGNKASERPADLVLHWMDKVNELQKTIDELSNKLDAVRKAASE